MLTSTRYASKVFAPERVLGGRLLLLPLAVCVPLVSFYNVRTSVSATCVLIRSTIHFIQYITEKLFKVNERKDLGTAPRLSSRKIMRSSKLRNWSRAVGLVSSFSPAISRPPSAWMCPAGSGRKIMASLNETWKHSQRCDMNK